MIFTTKSSNQTISLGRDFGKKLKGGEVFLLVGDLGSGKTQFTKGLAFGLGIKDHITSPTFIYQNIYKGKDLKLYHFDLYRNEVVDEDIKNLIKEAYDDPKGVTVIEWAEHEKDNWPPRYHLLKFLWLSENDRKIELKLVGEEGSCA